MNNKRHRVHERRKASKKNKSYIRGIANEFTKENLLVAVESVDYETEKLVDLSLEGERLRLRHFGSTFYDLEIQEKMKRGKERVAEKMQRRKWSTEALGV